MSHALRTRALAGTGLIGLALITACGSGGSSDENTVRVGLSGAFSGPIAYYGQDSEKGIEIAIEQLSEQTDLPEFELVTADDECTPQGGAAAFRRLIDVEQVDVILGSPCSGATLGGMPVVADSEVPAMTFGSTNSKISEDSGVGGNAYMWRMNIDDAIMGTAWAAYIADQGVTSAAIYAANNDFGRGAADLYETYLPEVGIDVVATEFFELGTSDMRASLTKIDQSGAQALVVMSEPADCALMIRQIREIGMDIKVYGRGGCATAEMIGALGDPTLADGVMEASYWAPTEDQDEFVNAYQAEHDMAAPYNAALGYYGMMTIAEAVAAGGNDPASIQEALSEVDWTSGIGPITFDDHNQAHPHMFILEIVDGAVDVLDVVSTS